VIMIPGVSVVDESPLDHNLAIFPVQRREMGHSKAISSCGVAAEEISYMNLVGRCGWYVAGRVFRQGVITK